MGGGGERCTTVFGTSRVICINEEGGEKFVSPPTVHPTLQIV